MDILLLLTIVAILLAFVFDFTNGFHDASNLVATLIASRSMTPGGAVMLAAVFEFLGPMLGGTAVANTIGKVVHADSTGALIPVVLAAVSSAIAWNLVTWYWGLPSSSSHAILGGLIGASIAASRSTDSVNWGFVDFDPLHPSGVAGIGAALLFSPILGFFVGFAFQRFARLLLQRATPRANVLLRRLQLFTAAALAFSHGTNDAQKTMGIVTMLLLSGGWISTFAVPFWVKIVASAAIATGAVSGGWRIMRTLGRGIFRVRPIHGLSSQAASAGIILGNALIGGPVSTTHVVSSTIMGVGAADRVHAVRWTKVKDILATWVITFPASALLGALLLVLIQLAIGPVSP